MEAGIYLRDSFGRIHKNKGKPVQSSIFFRDEINGKNLSRKKKDQSTHIFQM